MGDRFIDTILTQGKAFKRLPEIFWRGYVWSKDHLLFSPSDGDLQPKTAQIYLLDLKTNYHSYDMCSLILTS